MDITIESQHVELNHEPGRNWGWMFLIALAPNDRIASGSLNADKRTLYLDVVRTEQRARMQLHKGAIVKVGHKAKLDARMEYIGAVRIHLFGGIKGYLFINKDAERD